MMPPREVLSRLPGPASLSTWHAIRYGRGFSGAALWRGEIAGQSAFALKRYPDEFPSDRLAIIQTWWKQASHLSFVPKLLFSQGPWELATWMPGSPIRWFTGWDAGLNSACETILQLHDVWKSFRTSGTIPALRRRIDILQAWRYASESGPRSEAHELIQRFRTGVIESLAPWMNRRYPLQPILADVHAEHVLFTGNTVTGVIDFGSMKIDHVAVDAARYLGDTCGDAAFHEGCERFAQHHGREVCPPELVGLLHRSGILASLAYWLERPDRTAEASARLIRQIACWKRLAHLG